ncbi:MAG TPA: DUF3662 and FHA domain-containing protein [Nitrolancea sp.]|nr:DUF3662 and FHA domain-containing protein [Nitrolancea sp.]
MVGSLQHFERFFERLMEGAVGRIFRSPVQPAEIGRRLERAMDDNQLATVDGPVVPNDYTVHLNPDDMVLFADFTTTLCRQMEDWLIDLADERNFGFVDQVRVQMVGDERVAPRGIMVDAHIAELPGYSPEEQEAVQRTEVYRVVEQTGSVPPKLLQVINGVNANEVFVVRLQVTSIGRALDNDIVLSEAEVSRHHARIEYQNGTFEVVDLGSTNGTSVNGVPVSRGRLHDGDVIGLGTARLELIPYGSAGD